MSLGRHQNQGTGLGDVFDILVKLPPERLQSLTFLLVESPETDIIHALCLIIQQKKTQALDKLQRLSDNCIAKHLAEKLPLSKGRLEDFGAHCGHLEELTQESLVTLARMFRFLSEQRLCDVHVTFLAYKRALTSCRPSNCKGLEYDQLQEEAKGVCGPHYADWMSSSMDLKSNASCDLPSSLSDRNSTLKVSLSEDWSQSAHSLPSPLQASASMPSYPTHLEISVPPTACFLDDKSAPATLHDSEPNISSILSETESKNAPGQSLRSEESQSSEPLALTASRHSLEALSDCSAAESMRSNSHMTLVQPVQPTSDFSVVLPIEETTFPPKILPAKEIHDSNSAEKEEDEEEEEEEEEEIFYAFVILHASEDTEMAESMRDKLEKVIGTEGATFSAEFATPGKSTLRCVADAINNTAFTILLLTRNFNTRLLEVKTDSALINSINKEHKYNTVIPLLPRENSLPRKSMPLVLQTINPLEENRNFEKRVQKVLSQAQINKQRKIWARERMVKMEVEKQGRLKQLNEHQKEWMKEFRTTQLLEKEYLRHSMTQKLVLSPSVPPEQDGGDGRPCWTRNIHIENAKYIMIGNDSQMTVDTGGDQDGLPFKEEDQ